MIGLICAMEAELSPYLLRLERGKVEHEGGLAFYRGLLCGRQAVLLRSGVGKVNAAMGAQAMIQKYHPKLILHTGVGGSLTPALRVGDVLVAEELVQYDVDTTALGDPPGFVSTVEKTVFTCEKNAVNMLMQAAKGMSLRGIQVVRGRVATGDRFIEDRAEKHELARRFSAQLCEQEGCAIAQVCYVNGTDCAVVRAVSDADEAPASVDYKQYVAFAAGRAAELACLYLEKFG